MPKVLLVRYSIYHIGAAQGTKESGQADVILSRQRHAHTHRRVHYRRTSHKRVLFALVQVGKKKKKTMSDPSSTAAKPEDVEVASPDERPVRSSRVGLRYHLTPHSCRSGESFPAPPTITPPVQHLPYPSHVSASPPPPVQSSSVVRKSGEKPEKKKKKKKPPLRRHHQPSTRLLAHTPRARLTSFSTPPSPPSRARPTTTENRHRQLQGHLLLLRAHGLDRVRRTRGAHWHLSEKLCRGESSPGEGSLLCHIYNVYVFTSYLYYATFVYLHSSRSESTVGCTFSAPRPPLPVSSTVLPSRGVDYHQHINIIHHPAILKERSALIIIHGRC